MSEKIEISDVKEFNKQRSEEIYKNGKYAELRILVGYNETIPISELDIKEVKVEDIARLICAVDNQLEHIMHICPEAFEVAECMSGEELYAEESDDE